MDYIFKQPKPEWSPLPRPGCRNVEFRVLLSHNGLAVANLRFSADAEIDEHDAPYDIEAICLAGTGFVSVDGHTSEFSAGQSAHWPKNTNHKLWTTASTMETLMIERIYQASE